MRPTVVIRGLIPLLATLLLALPVHGQDSADDGSTETGYVATTTKNPDIPVENLRILLRPLTMDELQTEAEAWLDLVRVKSKEVALAEVAVRQKNAEIDKSKEAAALLEEAKEAAEEAKQDGGDAEGQAEAQKKLEEAKAAAEEAARVEAEADEGVVQAERDAAAEAEKEAAEEAKEESGEEGGPDETVDPPPDPKPLPAESTTADIQKALESAGDAGADGDAVDDDVVEKAKAAAEAKAEGKTNLLEHVNRLREQRTALLDRLEAVLLAFERKGGDVEPYEKYVTAVSGITVDVTDTEAAWAMVRGWIMSKEGGLRWGKNLGMFILTIIGFIVLSRIIGKGTEKALRLSKGSSGLFRDIVVKTVRRVIVLVGIVMALSALEIDVGPVLAAIGAAGFVVAFALQGTLSNFASGLMILFYKPFDVGDAVEVAGVSGKVRAMSLMTTELDTFDNKSILVPNNSIWNNVITNATKHPTRRVDMVFGIGYGDDIGKAKSILESVVKDHPLVLSEPAPTIQVNELGDSSVNLICRPWTKTSDYWALYWEVMQTVKERFDAEGISIPFPQRDVHVFEQAKKD